MPADAMTTEQTRGRIDHLQVGLQMWTMREQMESDTLGCIDEVGAAGFTGVELVGYGSAGFAAVRDRLQSNEMRAISQHVPYRRFAGEFQTLLEEMLDLGADEVVIQQGRDADFADVYAVAAFAQTCNTWGRQFADAGIALGYHGYHDLTQEFAPYRDGTRFDLFVELTDPAVLFLQLDTYWVGQSGNDPATLLRRYPDRVPSLHLKDTSTDPDVMDTTVGDGTMDLPGILRAALETDTRWVFIEQEGAPQQAFEDIRRSRANILRALDVS